MSYSPMLLRRATSVALALLLTVFGLIAVMSLRSSASADPYPPSSGCSVSSPSAVVAGANFTLVGSGFPANSTVQLTMHSDNVSLGSVRTDGNGSFADSVQLPASLSGTGHEIVASSGSTTCSLSANATAGVEGARAAAPGATDPPTASQNNGTANTGFAAITATVIALVLLGGGLVFVAVGRRRRAQG